MTDNKWQIPQPKCAKCGYEWYIQRPTRPAVCPKCKSRKWEEPDHEDKEGDKIMKEIYENGCETYYTQNNQK